MSLVLETYTPIDNLIQSSLSPESKHKLEWIPCSQITNIKPTQIDNGNVYYAIRKQAVKETTIVLLCLGSSEECTPTLVSEFAKIYSLPTHEYKNNDNNFKRYTTWLKERNELIMGFTKTSDKSRNNLIKRFTKSNDNYYMVAKRRFDSCYSRYGFCTACQILRCSPVCCICGNKQLSNGWTSNNKQLDDFIKKSQLQTNSPNHAYLEWIPGDCIYGEYHAELY